MSLSMMPDVTASAGGPRIAAIAHPMGRALGLPGDATGQREVLRATLRVVMDAKPPETLTVLPFTWTESPSRARASRDEPAPIVQLLKRKPWLLVNLLSGSIPGADSARGEPTT